MARNTSVTVGDHFSGLTEFNEIIGIVYQSVLCDELGFNRYRFS